MSYGYNIAGDENWVGSFDTPELAQEAGEKEMQDRQMFGEELTIAEFVHPIEVFRASDENIQKHGYSTPWRFLGNDVFENIVENADQEVLGDECCAEMSFEKIDELGELIANFIRENSSVNIQYAKEMKKIVFGGRA
jgi:hypothetical protein